MSIGWVFAVGGAAVALASTILSQYFVSQKNKKIVELEGIIQKGMNDVEIIRDYEVRAKSSLNHYEELVSILQLQKELTGKIGIGLKEAAKEAFEQGMAFRYSAAKQVPHESQEVSKESVEWKELIDLSFAGNATGLTEARGKLLAEYMARNNQLIKTVGENQAKKRELERDVDKINRWNFGFLVVGILIALLKDLFV